MAILDFPLQQQECSEWCWAAIASAVTSCYKDDPPLSQREVVARVLGADASNCNCEQNPTLPCNQGQNLDWVLDQVQHGGASEDSMPFSEVTGEIDGKRPIVVQVSLEEVAASGHAVAIYGYSDDGHVLIADPMRAGDRISVAFDDFVNGRDPNYHAKWQKAYKTLPL